MLHLLFPQIKSFSPFKILCIGALQLHGLKLMLLVMLFGQHSCSDVDDVVVVGGGGPMVVE